MQHWTIDQDYEQFPTEAAAIAAAEAQGSTCIVSWVGHHNRPGLQPAIVWQSTAMQRRNAAGAWEPAYIHG